MRNTFLIVRREYLERVKTKSFLVLTFLVPVLMAAMVVLPVKLGNMKSEGTRRLVIVTADESVGKAIQQQLVRPAQPNDATEERNDDKPARYSLTISTTLTEAERSLLRQQITDGKIDGFLWITPEALNSRQIEYYSKESTNFSEHYGLQAAVQIALVKQKLAGYGLNAQQAGELLKSVSLQAVRVQKGKESKNGGLALFVTGFIMVLTLYMSVLLYGIAVMRAIIEEKSSRIMEVMLASTTPKELMAGKILGVGAVGLTQIAIWASMSAVLALPGTLLASNMINLQLPPSTGFYFAAFFILGYLLYSAMYAALGAMVNTEQEAQQLQFVVFLPLVLAISLVGPVLQNPGSQLAFWLSMIPFCAPLLMFVRIFVETPPAWQIVLSMALMVVSIYGMLVLSARIYRVGILMYGKRPTLPELLKWIRYA